MRAPAISVTWPTDPRSRRAGKAASAVADSLTRVRVNPDRFVKSLVTDPGCIDEPLDLMEDLFMLAAITQDVSHLGIEPFYEIFTEKELYALWECENLRRYLIMGPSARFGDPLVADGQAVTAQYRRDGRPRRCG